MRLTLSARAFRDVSALPACTTEEIADPSDDMIGLFHSRNRLRKFQSNCSNKGVLAQKSKAWECPRFRCCLCVLGAFAGDIYVFPQRRQERKGKSAPRAIGGLFTPTRPEPSA